MSEHNFQINVLGSVSCLRCGCSRYTILGTESRGSEMPCPGRGTFDLIKSIKEAKERRRKIDQALAGVTGRSGNHE